MKYLLYFLVFFCLTAKAQVIRKVKIEDVVRYFDKKNDSVYVINFWATFCKPCVAEIPHFIRTVNDLRDKKVSLLLVSLDLPADYPNKIREFVRKRGFQTNIVWLNETNADYFCPVIDKSWSGAIPATLIVNNKSAYKKFFEEELSPEEFQKQLNEALKSGD